MRNFSIFLFHLFLANILLQTDFEGLLELFALDKGWKFIGSCIILFEFGRVGREAFEDGDGLDDVGG